MNDSRLITHPSDVALLELEQAVVLGKVHFLARMMRDPSLQRVVREGWALTDGLTLLGRAVACRQLPILLDLLTWGADVEELAATGTLHVTDDRGITPLHLAVCHPTSYDHFAERAGLALLRAGADPNRPDNAGRTPLHDAASPQPSLLASSALLDFGADPHIPDEGGNTPESLLVPLRELVPGLGQVDLEQVRATRAGIEARSRAGDTAYFPSPEVLLLERSARLGDIGGLRAALSAGADIDTPVCRGQSTALHLASSFGHAEAVDFLLQSGATVNVTDFPFREVAPRDHRTTDYVGRTPLHWAAIRGCPVTLKCLLDAGADTAARDAARRTPLGSLSDAGDPAAAASVLLSAGANPNAVSSHDFAVFQASPIHRACARGQADVLEVLLAAGGDPEIRESGAPPLVTLLRHDPGRTDSLTEAQSVHYTRCTQLLLDAGADPMSRTASHSNTTVRELAWRSGGQASLEAIVNAAWQRHGMARPSMDNALLEFAALGDARSVGHCLSRGVNREPAARPRWHEALRLAAQRDHAEVVRLLLAVGADPNGDNPTNTPLMAAMRTASLNAAAVLLEAGADPFLRSGGPAGYSAAGVACASGDMSLVQLLMDHGVPLDQIRADYRSWDCLWYDNPSAVLHDPMTQGRIATARFLVPTEEVFATLPESLRVRSMPILRSLVQKRAAGYAETEEDAARVPQMTFGEILDLLEQIPTRSPSAE